ncbi:MAG: hypothetical protein JNL98_17700 [Bryobacterales bacterium]|nr:hypothetical protein [Bryobacterales bacterium]
MKRKPGRPSKASEAARILGALGASKGGKARAAALSPERRTEISHHAGLASVEPRMRAVSPARRRAIARKAAAARWARKGATT